MIVLFFLACLASTCRPVELVDVGTMHACLLAAQPAVAHWLTEHPGYVLRGRVRCSVGRAA